MAKKLTNSLVLRLCVALCGKADKVIMTMVTLIGKPVESTSLLTHLTPPTPCCSLSAPIASNLTLHSHETHLFPLPACLCDIPTNAPMTAAALNDNDGDWSLCHPPSLIFDDNNPTLTPIDPQEWDDFYNKFLQFVNSFNNTTLPKTMTRLLLQPQPHSHQQQ